MLKVAVAGAGFWGVNHLRVLKELPDCELVAVCDLDIGRAEKAANRFGVASFFKDLDDMLKTAKPDAVTICTPSTTHAPIALKLLEAGCDILIEKPMSTNVEEAAKIIEQAERTGRTVMVGFIERFNPAVQQAHKLISGGEIGEVLLMYSRRIGSWPERIGDTGVVKDTAIHDIDLAGWILNEVPETVYAKCGKLRHSHEDHAQVFLSYGERRSALMEANWLTPRKKREMHITGEKGVVSVRFIEQELVVEKAEQLTIPNIPYSEPLKRELAHFIECIHTGRQPLVTAFDGFKAIFIAECILMSSETNKPVKIAEAAQKLKIPYRLLGDGAARI
ncbi:MAG: Gfo/Idh/MocA family oxidoreductase [Candidatus Caldarchaeum sp.]